MRAVRGTTKDSEPSTMQWVHTYRLPSSLQTYWANGWIAASRLKMDLLMFFSEKNEVVGRIECGRDRW